MFPSTVMRSQPASWRRIASGALLAAATLIGAYVSWQLWRGEYGPRLVWLFWIDLALAWFGFTVGDWTSTLPVTWNIRWWEIAAVLAALIYFLVVNVRDIDSWRYAAIGDEYAFFDVAKAIENGTREVNIFSQIGVYDQRPFGTSAIQALTMAIFGADSFGWRIATPLALASAIPAVWLVARELFGRAVAIFAVLVFATSHYLISYAHTPYDNVWALTPFTWATALAVIGMRRNSAPWLFAAGAVAGLGFYTFPTARMAPMVIGLFGLSLGWRYWRPGMVLPIAAGLLLAGLPLFASDGWDAISVSRDRTVFGFTDSQTEGVNTRILQNVPRTLLAFNYSPDVGHFASGSLLDPVVAVLFVAGVCFSLSRVRRPEHRLAAIWLGVTLLFAGIFSPYDRVAFDRLHLALPVVAIYAGVGIVVVSRSLVSYAPRRFDHLRTHLWMTLFGVLACILAALNLHRFYVESPSVVPTTEERLALGGLMSEECKRAGDTLVLVREPRPLLNPAVAAFGIDRPITTGALRDARKHNFRAYECIVVTRLIAQAQESPGDLTGAQAVVMLERDYGFETARVISTPVMAMEAVVLRPR